MVNIAIAVACYNNEKEVLNFAEALKRQNWAERIRLLITCNSVKDFELFQHQIKEILPSTLVFNPGKNLGYLYGCLYGVAHSSEQYNWVMISNTDIDLQEEDFFESALSNVDNDIWSIGPEIVLMDGVTHQNPFLEVRPSRKRIILWKLSYSCYPLYWLHLTAYRLKAKKAVNYNLLSRDVYAIHGSCMLLKNECIEKLLEEEAKIFMYEEELLVAEIVRENKKRCHFNSEIHLVHNEKQVTGTIKRKQKQKWFKESFDYLYNRFYRNDIAGK